MRNIILASILFFIFSCKDENEIKKSESLSVDSANFIKSDTVIKSDNHFEIAFKDIYSVYELSDSTIAFVVNFSNDDTERKTVLDTIFEKVFTKEGFSNLFEESINCKDCDTLGQYNLIWKKQFEEKIKPYFDKEYFVYGTGGVTKLRYYKVLIGIDECKTNIFAFCFDKKLVSQIGHPLICTSTNLNLEYLKDYNVIETKIYDFLKKIPMDYTDSINAKVFASLDKYYFTYSDDFLWKNVEKTKCSFPTRSIYFIDDVKIKSMWSDGLDLFGIPCD